MCSVRPTEPHFTNMLCSNAALRYTEILIIAVTVGGARVQYVEHSSIMKGHSILLCSTRHGTRYDVEDGAIRAVCSGRRTLSANTEFEVEPPATTDIAARWQNLPDACHCQPATQNGNAILGVTQHCHVTVNSMHIALIGIHIDCTVAHSTAQHSIA